MTKEQAASTGDAARRTSSLSRWLLGAISPLCGLVVVVSAAIVLSLDYGRDQAIYALVAREILRGGMPYRDAFDFKPPGIFLVYTLARAAFGASQRGIRILEVLSMIATVVALRRLSRVYTGSTRAGWIAAALASQVHAQLDFWHTGQPETFGGMLTVVGLVVSSTAHARMRANEPRRAAIAWAVAGVLFGAAGLMKPPLAGAGAVVAGLSALSSLWPGLEGSDGDPPPLRTRLVSAASTLAATALGGAIPFAAVLVWFSMKGALHDMHEVLLVFTPHYTKLSWENASVLGMGYFGFSEWLLTYSGALLFGMVALIVTRPTPREAPLVIAVSAVIFVHIVGVVMQAKFFPYHWGATFPLSAILAGLGLEKASRWALEKGRLATAGLVASFSIVAAARAPVPNLGSFLGRAAERFSLFVTGPMDPLRRDALASVGGVDAAQNRAVSLYIHEHTAPDAPIFVWGFECVIYDLAERPLSSRFIYNVPQRAAWSKEPMRQALMRELADKPPAAIVVEHRDVFAFVTGDELDSAQSLEDFRALRQLIDDDYNFASRVGDFDVYVRADAEH